MSGGAHPYSVSLFVVMSFVVLVVLNVPRRFVGLRHAGVRYNRAHLQRSVETHDVDKGVMDRVNCGGTVEIQTPQHEREPVVEVPGVLTALEYGIMPDVVKEHALTTRPNKEDKQSSKATRTAVPQEEPKERGEIDLPDIGHEGAPLVREHTALPERLSQCEVLLVHIIEQYRASAWHRVDFILC